MVNDIVICPNCKKEIPHDSTFCPHCGLKLKSQVELKNAVKKCKKCGTLIKTSRLSYCPICLTELDT
ncbi:MAG: double zinc ribbon domain-containing protein [Candidatus Helarchaeota archaeon]